MAGVTLPLRCLRLRPAVARVTCYTNTPARLQSVAPHTTRTFGAIAAAKIQRRAYAAAATAEKPTESDIAARAAIMGPNELASTAFSLATQKPTDEKAFSAIVEAAHSKLYRLKPQPLATITLSMALASHQNHTFLKDAAKHAFPIVNTFSAQDTATFAWALARLGRYNRKLFSALAVRGAYTMDDMNLQATSLMVSAYAQKGDFNYDLFRAAQRRVRRYAAEFAPRDLAVTAQAFATGGRGVVSNGIFRYISDAAKGRLKEYSPQDLDIMCRALLKAQHVDDALGAGVREAVVAKWGTLTDADKAKMVTLLRDLKVPHGLVNLTE